MAATFEFNEDNGTQTGSPLKGTTRTTAVTQVNWKNIDDVATAYTASPITAGANSFSKYTFGKFTGTFNSVGSGLFAHTAGTLGTGLTLKSAVTTTYATPTTTAVAAFSTDITTAIAITSGATVLFSTVGPEGASPTTSIATAGYSQYLGTQLQTTGSAAAGDIGSITLTLRYNEN